MISGPDLGALYGFIRSGLRHDGFGENARKALDTLGEHVAQHVATARSALDEGNDPTPHSDCLHGGNCNARDYCACKCKGCSE